MPWVRTADSVARKYLFSEGVAEMARRTGINSRTLLRRKEKPGNITLDELAQIVKESGTTKEELYEVVKSRG